MKLIDVIYRAFLEYKKNTKEDKECNIEKNYIRSSNAENDSMQFISYNITIDTDWIEAIELGLEAIDKCVRERRQFIRVNGEVVKIEKVKRVSKDSVVHLARHADLIRRYSGQDLIPDELFMTEKLSDFAVYENRFLYLLLCYLRDFISFRYDEIVEYSNKYQGKLKINKSINYLERKLEYSLNLDEQINNDEYRIKNNKNLDMIERIKNLLSSVMFYLKTDLMIEVSKVPVIKPPIVKTNVLRMNQNFKKAVALYEYITAYDKKGYEIEKKVKKISPFPKEIGDEIAETIQLQKFLTYEYNNEIQKDLKEAYLEEEERRKQVELEKNRQQLKLLKKKVEVSGLSMEEYMLELENQNKLLEKDSQQLIKAKEEIKVLNNTIDEMKQKIESQEQMIQELNDIIVQKDNEIKELIIQHEKEIQELTDKYENQIKELIDNYTRQIQELTDSYEAKIQDLINDYEKQLQDMKLDYETKIEDLTNSYEQKIVDLKDSFDKYVKDMKKYYEDIFNDQKQKYLRIINNLKKEKEDFIIKKQEEINVINKKHDLEIVDLDEKIVASNTVIINKNAEIAKINEIKNLYLDEKHILLGELNALRQTKGKSILNEDFTSEERFKELERELAAFKKLFNKEWQKTKRRIYKEAKESILKQPIEKKEHKK